MKISKKRLLEIINEEIQRPNLELKSLKDNALEAIEALADEEKMKILAYISSLEGNPTNE